MKKISKIGRFKITFEFGLSAILMIFGLLIVLLYLFLNSYRQEIIFIVSVIGGSAAIYTAYYKGETLKRNYEYTKQSKTFEFIQRFDQIDFAKMRAYLDTSFDIMSMKQSEIFDKIISDSELFLAVRSLMNLCEDFSIAVQRNFIDEEIAFLSVEEVYRMYVHKFRPYIEGQRKKYGSSLIYIESEKLAHSWEIKQYITTGEIIEE